MSTSSTLATILPILQTLINDVPKAINVIEIILPALKEGRNLTTEEWDKLDALADEAHKNLQS